MLRITLSVLLVLLPTTMAAAGGPCFATGIRIGEVDADSAIVWVRLTRDAKRVDFGAPMPVVTYVDPSGKLATAVKDRDPSMTPVVTFPGITATDKGDALEKLEGAVPGMVGEARVRFRVAGAAQWRETAWEAVDAKRDYTRQFQLDGLESGARYEVEVEGRATEGAQVERIAGKFRTPADPETPKSVSFVVSTCQDYPDRDAPDGFKIYPAISKLDPDFFVHAGDILYYDQLAKSAGLARWHWQCLYSLPSLVSFHQGITSYFMKDDHDTWVNDCWPTMQSKFMGDFTFAQGLEIFREQVPMGETTYRTIRWGRDLQIWLVEGRDFRSPNNRIDGPEKTIWGAEQKAWFKRTVAESDATFRVLISPTPVVGPDRGRKNDNHANSGFAHEGRELREFIAAQKNMFTICGDRHWQYVSRDAASGLMEFSCGPASDAHAGGWDEKDQRPEHRYLNVIGGFLSVTVAPEGDKAILKARHHGVDGAVLHEEILRAE